MLTVYAPSLSVGESRWVGVTEMTAGDASLGGMRNVNSEERPRMEVRLSQHPAIKGKVKSRGEERTLMDASEGDRVSLEQDGAPADQQPPVDHDAVRRQVLQHTHFRSAPAERERKGHLRGRRQGGKETDLDADERNVLVCLGPAHTVRVPRSSVQSPTEQDLETRRTHT